MLEMGIDDNAGGIAIACVMCMVRGRDRAHLTQKCRLMLAHRRLTSCILRIRQNNLILNVMHQFNLHTQSYARLNYRFISHTRT